MILTQGEKAIEVSGCLDCPFCHWKCRHEDDDQMECWLDEKVSIGRHNKPLTRGAPCPLVSGPVFVGKV